MLYKHYCREHWLTMTIKSDYINIFILVRNFFLFNLEEFVYQAIQLTKEIYTWNIGNGSVFWILIQLTEIFN